MAGLVRLAMLRALYMDSPMLFSLIAALGSVVVISLLLWLLGLAISRLWDAVVEQDEDTVYIGHVNQRKESK